MKYSFAFLRISLFFILLIACSYSKDLQIIRSANNAHYNLAAAGLKSFSCKIEAKEINETLKAVQDMFPDDPMITSIKKIQIIATITNKGYIGLELSDGINTGDEKLDKSFEHLIRGAKEVISSFFSTWGNLTFQPIFPNMDLDYKISSNLNSYCIEYTQDSVNVSARLTKESRLTEFIDKTVEDNLSYKTNFVDTEKGYLLKSYTIRLINDSTEVDTEIDYQQIEGFFLPQTVRILHKLKTGPVDVTLFFSDYKLDKY
jgi:hypothetical protein